MANNIAPFGFRQFRRLDGGAPTAGFDSLSIASSDTNLYFTGDAVATSATGPYITAISTIGVLVRGIFFGCEFFSPTVGRKVWSPFFPGSVQTSSGTNDALAWVCTDPEMMYTVQCSSITNITSSMIGTNTGVNFTVGLLSSQGNQTTGISAQSLSTATVTNSSFPFRIMDLWSNWTAPGSGFFNFAQNLPGPGGTVNGTDNTSVGNIVVVAPNNFDRKNTTGV
jgi:hypothetical protein